MCAYLDSLSANLLDDGLKIILDLQDVSLEAQSTFVSLATHHLSRKHTQILFKIILLFLPCSQDWQNHSRFVLLFPSWTLHRS